jgi:HAD superfamily hydrolase (TIGR01509 family)
MKAVLFDFDGIICDTLQINFEVKRECFRPFAELSEKDFIDIWVSPEPGKEGTPYYIKLRRLSLNPEACKQSQKPLFEKAYSEKAALIPGSAELVKRLKGRGLPLAVVSSNYRAIIELALRKFRLLEAFDFIVSAEDTRRHKPDPMPYALGAKRTGFRPEQVLVIEDSDTGVQSAKAAGCKCIAIPNKFTKFGDFSEADLVLESLSQINEQVLKKF